MRWRYPQISELHIFNLTYFLTRYFLEWSIMQRFVSLFILVYVTARLRLINALFSDVLCLWVSPAFPGVSPLAKIIQSCHVKSILIRSHWSWRFLVFPIIFSGSLIPALYISLRGRLFIELAEIFGRYCFIVMISH